MWWLAEVARYNQRILQACEAEPVTTPGAIQGAYGALLLMSPDWARIWAFSANLPLWLTGSWSIDQPAPAALLSWLQQEAQKSPAPAASLLPRAFLQDACRDPLLVRFVQHKLGWLIEFRMEPPAFEQVCSSFQPQPRQRFRHRWRPEEGLAGAERLWKAMAEKLVETIAAESGYQRVLYYRFRPEGDGEVFAEARLNPWIGSYLDLRFPASDIPQQVRRLYKQAPWRHIPDVCAEPVPLIAANPPSLDLSQTDLRAVSPLHCAYLTNMGVRASTSFPICVGRELIALVACHHPEPRLLPYRFLAKLSQIIKTHQHDVIELHLAVRTWYLEKLAPTLAAFLSRFPLNAWPRHWGRVAPWLTTLFDAEGAHWLEYDSENNPLEQLSFGVSLTGDALAALEENFAQQPQEPPLFVVESLAALLSPAPPSEAAGFIRLAWRGARKRVLYLTRGEELYEVSWAGNPHKPLETMQGGVGIAPRRSFERWVEARIGHCRPWPGHIVLAATQLWNKGAASLEC